MITNPNENINYSECIATEFLMCSNEESKELTPPSLATKALLQFYTDDYGEKVIGFSRMCYWPIVSLTQNEDKPTQGYKGIGFKIANMRYCEIHGLKNIANTKFIPFSNGYPLFCFIQYFK